MPTLKEIAHMAQVSVGTVDRVIHGRGRVSPETAQRVKRIIRELDYKPNILARSLSLSRTFCFAVLIPQPSQDGSYWELPLKGIERAQRELDVYKVKVKFYYYDKYNERSFENAIQKLLQQVDKFDGLLLAPVLSKITEKYLQRIPDHLPYIFIDSYIPHSHCLSYVGEDSFQSGVLSAKLMAMLVNDPGSVAILKVIPKDYHIEDRIRGFKSYYDELSQWTIKTYSVNACENGYANAAKQIIAENDDLQGIFTPNACTFYIAQVVREIIAQRKIYVVGYDLVSQNIQYLEEGTIDFLISQRSEMQGYQSIYNLYRNIVLNEKIEPRVFMPLDIITKENLRFYQN